MKTICTVIAFICAACVGAARAEWPPRFADFHHLQLEPLRTQGMPVLYAECLIPPNSDRSFDPEDTGKIALILPVGSSKGEFVELWWKRGTDHSNPAYMNAADVDIVPEVDLGELGFGGIWTIHYMIAQMKFLLTQPFVFVRPENFAVIAKSDPTVACPDPEIIFPRPEEDDRIDSEKQ